MKNNKKEGDIMMYKFTSRAQKALEIANNIAQELGHSYIGTEHILYGLTEEGAGVAARVLENQGINSEDVKSKIEELTNRRNIRIYSKNKKNNRKFLY